MPEDVNCSGGVNGGDIGIIAHASNFLQDPPANPRTDVNGDGQVNAADIGFVAHRMSCNFSNVAPVAFASAELTADAGAPVSFDASNSSDANNAIVSYEWDFGDGSEGNGVSVDHTFANAGQYTVTLFVTDSCGAESIDEVVVDVASSAAPCDNSPGLSANFCVEQGSIDIKMPVSFQAAADEELVLAFLWSFGDGSSGYGAQASHAYDFPGSYTVELTVISTAGEVLVGTQDISVNTGLTLLSVASGSAVNMPRGFAVVGDVVWAAGDVQSIATADVSQSSSAAISQSATLYGAPWHLDADENTVAVAAGWNGLYLFDADSPNSLSPVGHLNTYAEDGSYTYQVALQGDLLFAACDEELKVIDISNRATPVQIGGWESGGQLGQVELVSGRALAYDAVYGGYRILNIDNPQYPIEVGSFETRDTPTDIALDGNLLAVSVGYEGVQFFDISDRDNPIELAHRDYSGEGAKGVALNGSHAYVANGSRIDDLNIDDPSNPWLIQRVGTGILTFRLEFKNGLLYASLAQRVVAVLEP